MIPTGELRPVKGTPLDFTAPTKIGTRIKLQLGGVAGDRGLAGGCAGRLSGPLFQQQFHAAVDENAHHLDFGAELRAVAALRDSVNYSGEELEFVRGVLERGLLINATHDTVVRLLPALVESRLGGYLRSLPR